MLSENIVPDELEVYKTTPWLPMDSKVYIACADGEDTIFPYIEAQNRRAIIKNAKWWHPANDKFIERLCEGCRQHGSVSKIGDDLNVHIGYLNANNKELVQRTERIAADERKYLAQITTPLSKYAQEFRARAPTPKQIKTIVGLIAELLQDDEGADKVLKNVSAYLKELPSVAQLVDVASLVIMQLTPKVREMTGARFIESLRRDELADVLNGDDFNAGALAQYDAAEFNTYTSNLQSLIKQNVLNSLIKQANPSFTFEYADTEALVPPGVQQDLVPPLPQEAEPSESTDGGVEQSAILSMIQEGKTPTIAVFEPMNLMDFDSDTESENTIDSTLPDDENYGVVEEIDEATERDGAVDDICKKCGNSEKLPFKSVLWMNGRPVVVKFCSINCIEDLDWNLHKLKMPRKS